MDTTLAQSAVAPLASGLTLCNDGLVRPAWASHDELLRSYYDTEWGLPVHDEAGVFERLVLEGFQAGLSWRTVLAKREAFRADQQRSRNGCYEERFSRGRRPLPPR